MSTTPAYLVVNDVSVREWQRATPNMRWASHGTPWPIGPSLVTADEIPDPHDQRIRTWVDDQLRPDASTAQMIDDR
jgi:2-keto-4-pentenoate hydratase/2-oxohepta-3-ene-1,7-dioic acid hydratase in catechol pathway